MTDWTGSGTTIPSVPSSAPACLEYMTIADVRAEFGDDVVDDTDLAIQRRIDQLAAYIEDQVGHTFGRVLIARSTGTDIVQVTSTALIVGGDTYLFTAYPTLQELVTAINGSGNNYSVELLPHVRTDTPSLLLATHGAVTCGPTYTDRVILCSSALFCHLTGKRESHLFLPLPLATVNTVVEDLITIDSTGYWAVPGDSWLTRKSCSCLTVNCTHLRGRWSNAWPGNIGVSYVPTWWGRIPSSLSGLLLDAFSARAGVAPFEREDFGDYSYKRPTAGVSSWMDVLGSSAVRQYAVRFQP